MRRVEDMGIASINRLRANAQAGRVSPVLAALAALVICGGVTYYLLYNAGTGEEMKDGGGEIATTERSVPPSVAPGEPGTEGQTGSSHDPASAAAPERGADPAAKALPTDRRIHGSVTDDEGNALAGRTLRWIPIGRYDLRAYSHDSRLLGRSLGRLPGRLLGDATDPSRVPAGRLRTALSRSEFTSSAADGTYELRVPIAGEPGVVVVSGSGYEMQIRSAAPDRPDADHPVAQAPATVDYGASKTGSSKDESSKDMEIHFTLGPASAISGKVTDVDSGEFVPGMAVVAGVVNPESPAMRSHVSKTAASSVVYPDGTYLLSGLKPGVYRVLPRTGDSDYIAFFTREATKVELEAGLDVTDVDFQVTRGTRVYGTVTGLREEAVQGAECKVLPTDFMAAAVRGDVEAMATLGSREDRTDSGGFYEVRGVPPGKYRVAVQADGYAAAKSDAIEAVGESVEANISLTAGSSISGHVFTADGNPAPGTPVSVIPDLGKIMAGSFEQAADGRNTETDASGAFRLEHLAAGEYRLQPGKVKPYAMMWGNQKKGTVVEVDGIHDVTNVELTIPGTGAGTLAGVVTDDEGTPIDGVSIQVMQPGDFMGMTSKKLKTDADGRFSASGLEGAVFRIGAEKFGYSSAKLSDVSIDSTDVEIILNRHGRVSGRVITLEGVSLVAGGQVRAQKIESQSLLENIQNRMPGGRGRNQDVTLNPDGTFSVDAPAGTIEILATVASFAPAVSASITVSPGQEFTGVEILVTSGAVLRGRVTMAGRGGIQGATVTATPFKEGDASDMMSEMMPQLFGMNRNQLTTDANGQFEVLHLAPGSYKLRAAHGDYAPSDSLTVSLARDEVREVEDLVLTVGGSINGRVLDVDRPKAGLMVQLIMGGGAGMKTGTTAADGSFEFKGIRTGEYMINVLDLAGMQKGKMKIKTRSVNVEDGQVTDFEVIYGIGHKVHGKIRGLPPSPMRMVTLRRPGGPGPEDLDPTDLQGGIAAAKYQAGFGMIGLDGEYEIVDLEPGEYILEIPRMPSDPTDMAGWKSMDRTPHYRKEIQMQAVDLELNIVVK